MKVEIITKTQAEKMIAKEIEKKEKFIFDKVETLQFRIAKLEIKLKEWIGDIKLPGKNEV